MVPFTRRTSENITLSTVPNTTRPLQAHSVWLSAHLHHSELEQLGPEVSLPEVSLAGGKVSLVAFGFGAGVGQTRLAP